ncbi:LPS-assembly protein LptD [Limimaricola sp.]|uniref:LPS-assembly protein LptD n=1 Tax=Limimaricola sp. TaxID=2211665 RepID=UPI0040582FDE
MIRRLLTALIGLAPALAPLPATAQGLAQLVADSVTVTAEETLVARGNVEAFYDGTRLSAAAISYDRVADRLDITGPILITTPEGEIFTARAAELSPQLEAGLLRGARLVLDRQLQLAAQRIDRTGTGLTALTRTAPTSCRVCGGGPPLWEIRAARVVHDEEARQLYFDDASFHIRGVPVMWLPRMRLPDPTLERASGLLVPQLFSSDALGFGLKLPYFVRLGGRRDLTVTPWIATGARNLELRYRQAFRSGWTEIETHLSEDDNRAGLRYALLAEGAFALPRDTRLEFDIEAVSDDAFLLDYDLSDQDRLDSSLRAYRLQDDGYALAEITYYESLREAEASASLPPLVARLEREEVLTPAIGGRLTLRADADALWRDGTGDEASRDVARAGISADWHAAGLVGPGLLVDTELRAVADAYAVSDDPSQDRTQARLSQAAGVTLRWPLLRREGPATGATQILEPVVSLAYAGVQGDTVPNEDTKLIEFDATTLHATHRLPGEDLVEEGLSAGLGLRWSRIDTAGRTLSLQGGRLFRDRVQTGLSDNSDLSQRRSDWLVSSSLDFGTGAGFELTASFDDALDISGAEARVALEQAQFDLSAAYLWLEPDAAEGFDERITETSLDTTVRFGPRWSLSAQARYDIAAEAPVRAELGVGWRNECVTVDLSASRRYTDTQDVDPSTSFGLSVNLSGFSAGRPAVAAAGRCEG